MNIVFLDQNKWVDLARVVNGTPREPTHIEAYRQIKEAVSQGQLIAPLSMSHVIETCRQNDVQKRRAVAQVQADFSRGYVYRSRQQRFRLELGAALSRAFRTQGSPIVWSDVIVPGFMRAFSPLDTPAEIAAQARINAHMPPAEQYVDFVVNQPDETRRLAIQKFSEGNAELLARMEKRHAAAQAESPDLRYRIYFVTLLQDHLDEINAALRDMGRTWKQLVALGDETMRQFFENVPMLYIESQLARRLEGERRPLKQNDLLDMQSFCAAVPYSRALIAENHFVSLSTQAGLHRKYGVRIATQFDAIK